MTAVPVSGLGLTEAEAARRLAEAGFNALPAARRRTALMIAVGAMREPMFMLLIAAALLYLFFGDLGEGLFLLGGATASIGLVVFQEARSEKALAALQTLAQPYARVYRDGCERRIPARELVAGDVILIGEGERLPADGALVGGDVLSVDQSALTGESAPVEKSPGPRGAAGGLVNPSADDAGAVFSGTVVVRGQGVVEVTRTGPRSALGRIGTSLATIRHEPTPLQRTAGRLAGLMGVVALVFCGVVALAYGLLRHDWSGGALAGITLAISLIPEEFPMVLAIFLALGAWRLATHRVLVRRAAAIETLGAASVLCVDKTGTLTENRMQVARLWTPGSDLRVTGAAAPGPDAAALLRTGLMASAVRPVDPMDRAIHALSPPAPGPSLERAWPLCPERLAMVQLWRDVDGGWQAAAKGAPEAIFRLCRLDGATTGELEAVVAAYAAAGLRVLGAASAQGSGEAFDDPADAPFAFAGLIGFADPLRADAAAALAEATRAGIRVVMITGDHPATALAIAQGAGLDTRAGALTGAAIAALPDEALRTRLRQVCVFARIAPEQKLRIVQALKADGAVVAMTGDGVNDAPALEAAHIGVAMGLRGTDVAREAADLILLDDSFPSIVGGVRLGRRIFANLRRALIYITAVHVPIAGLAFAPILLGLPPVLFPMQIVLLELALDPLCSLVFEAEPSDEAAMRRPPRPRDEPLFGLRQVILALAQGGVLLAAVLGLYVWLHAAGHSDEQARGAAFVALVIGNLALALADSASGGPLLVRARRVYWFIAAAVVLVLTAVVAVAPFAALFRIALTDPWVIAAAITAGLAGGGWTALLRLIPARHGSGQRSAV